MSRTTNEFGGGEIVPAIEAITGVQAPVMADFVPVPFGTVLHEEGDGRRIQDLEKNLKSSSGIERIPFNGIDELDTEQGPNGETVYALNTGDSRIRFVGNWTTDTLSAGNTQLHGRNGSYVEVTFFGTGLNLLYLIDDQTSTGRIIRKTIDGVANTTENVYQGGAATTTTGVPGSFGLTSNTNVKTNIINNVAKNLNSGVARVHTIVLTAATNNMRLYGVEIINTNAAITQQPGADFDGRVEALSGTAFPIEPDNSTVPSVDGRNTSGTAATYGTHAFGARVLNYLTSGGQYKQSFNLADESISDGTGTQTDTTSTTYTFTFNSTSSFDIPSNFTDISELQVFAFGAGGGGGGGFAASGGDRQSGAGGGGGGRATTTFTRTTGNTTAVDFTITVAGAQGGGNGTESGGTDITTILTANSTSALTATAGNGGTGGIPGGGSGTPGTGGSGTIGTLTNWTAATGTTNTGQTGTSGIPADTGGDGGTVAGSFDGMGNFVSDVFPLAGDEGLGYKSSSLGATGSAGPGKPPGGAGGGAGSSSSSVNVGNTTIGGGGSAGRIVIIFRARNGLTGSTFGTTVTPSTAASGLSITYPAGGVAGTPSNIFSLAAHGNQEVIRRINFREFGANSGFATGTSSRAFTLDDGTTTLVGSNLLTSGTGAPGADFIGFGRTQDDQPERFFTLTFVGTGLDVFWNVVNFDNVSVDTTITVDGFSIGTIVRPTANFAGIMPIVSGLAYGTHTVEFRVPATGVSQSTNINWGVSDFIIYGPKKPEIPTLDVGSLELSDYNVMADYTQTVASSTDATTGLGGLLTLGKGLLRKMGIKEFFYDGNYGVGANAGLGLRVQDFNVNSLTGTRFGTTNGNSTMEYTFYGTGFDFRFEGQGDRSSVDTTMAIVVDPVADGDGDFQPIDLTRGTFYGRSGTNTLANTFVVGNLAANSSNNLNAQTNGQLSIEEDTLLNAGFVLNDLTLGVHTVRVIILTNANDFRPRAMDVITSVHFQNDNLKVGSEGLNNLTIDPIVEEDEQQVLNLGEAKAWINFDITTSSTINSSHNISAVIRASDSTARYYFDKPFKDSNYVVISTIFDTNNSPAATVLEQRANYVAINASLSGNEKQYIVCFGELIDE